MRSSLLGVVISSALAGCIVPDGARPEVALNVDAATAYVHRGMPQNQNEVLQGAAQVRLPTKDNGSMRVMTWGNMDLTNDKGDAWFPDGDSGHFSEIDVVADYSRHIGPVGVTAGVHNYNLPRGDQFPNGPRGATSELFLRLDGEIATIQPSLDLRFDVDQADGFYANAALAHDFVFNEKLDLRLDAGLGYSNEKHSQWSYDVSEAGLADLSGEATLGYKYDDHTRLHATLAGSTIIDSDLQDWFDVIGIDSDNVWLALGVSWSY